MEKPEAEGTVATRFRLVLRAYLLTMGAIVLIAILTFVFLVDASHCHSVTRGLGIVMGTEAVVFVASVALVGVRARAVAPGTADRVAIVVLYGMLLLATLVIFACGLMVAFNC